MSNERVRIEYNEELKPLETLLAGVKRAGDFVAHGMLELPMPKVEVACVGVLSFPVPTSQVAALIEQAVRAPFGRGEETILDTSVRKVWQLPPDKVRIGGKSWAASFEAIMTKVTSGLGCERAAVSAELYKMLVYDEGGFFRAHRDTEKSGGMFGTLVLVLPSAHRGGELVVRHAGREIEVDLSVGEVSEIAFAAFYADCEHEVRPISSGNRVCLVFNLIQKRDGSGRKGALTAPDYTSQIARVADLLGAVLGRAGKTTKIAWLLDHQYSPAGLAFSALKSTDAAKANVLVAAGARAKCAVHLGIVHIEESGPAEPIYDFQPRRRGRFYESDFEDDSEDDREEESSDADFDVVEVSDSSRYVDQWIDPQERAVAFGKLPLADGELLPWGALDEEKPDGQRLMEATGNEGASFERSYHRAAVVVWHRDRYADVLLQAGVGSALPLLKERIEAGADARSPAWRETKALARRMIKAWKDEPDFNSYYLQTGRPADRSEMLDLLGRLGDAVLFEKFLEDVVTHDYDGSENAALVARLPLLSGANLGERVSELVGKKMRLHFGHCVELVASLIVDQATTARADRIAALQRVAEAVVAALDEIAVPAVPPAGQWQPKVMGAFTEEESVVDEWDDDPASAVGKQTVNAALVANLLGALGRLAAPESGALRETAARKFAARPGVFDPVTVVVPALGTLRAEKQNGGSVRRDGAMEHLWTQSADFLLARSEFPPEAPKDWRQDAKLSCRCADCRELEAFVLNPAERSHRFRVRQDRRQHLHQMIEQHGLEMTHVTERKGSPQTLVGTKDRRGYQWRCEQYRQDVAALATLAGLVEEGGADSTAYAKRIDGARARHGRWKPE